MLEISEPCEIYTKNWRKRITGYIKTYKYKSNKNFCINLHLQYDFDKIILFILIVTYPHSDPTLIVTRHPTSSRTIYNYACATNSYDN